MNGKRVAIGRPARDAEMGAVQDFNDRVDVMFDMMRERIEAMPVSHGDSRRIGL